MSDVDGREPMPDFRRCQTRQVFMRAHVVEEGPNAVKRVLQSGWVVNVDLSDVRFDATKEAFDAPDAP